VYCTESAQLIDPLQLVAMLISSALGKYCICNWYLPTLPLLLDKTKCAVIICLGHYQACYYSEKKSYDPRFAGERQFIAHSRRCFR
jgi:hypothetical protein